MTKIPFALFSSALIASAFVMPAQAEEYNRVSFSTEVKSEISNDEMHAVMTKTAQASTAAAIAKELNNSINAAMQIAKRYPEVVVTTGRQSTYPRYANNSSKIVGFTGTASLNIKSNDFEKASQLIADLQSILVIQNIGFGVSKELRDSEEKRLKLQAIARFTSDAQIISQAFGANSYKIVEVSLGSNNYYHPMPVMATAKFAEASVESIPAQNLEAGTTTLNYSANGTIEVDK
ncbi:SIMPL domain-containing protein [Moraxella canis]|uniref:SIMPL domain-containing protein n=1 Tax=Moraxella canis TaxID=90239 RepID=UPI0006681E3A|nr:SIMPL domain-containing protein [Moraxella canis]